ncbi:GNAT family N-acetyltransferase [Catellatospora tritici]|uniref:GNAT family N-acetyltransferase n=1 Tax=Catellatospora tritici TaxID=2851566 RepID=UPI001C2D0791|nr:GNAT family N-acetyltransferase [Catellatospora tritici]MBV1853781.1 GNAT family N-acetyltransferase [Catellatospora tritici]
MDTIVQQYAVANLRRRPLVVETPGFVCGFDPDSTSPYLNYATPLPGAAPADDDVRELIAAFRERGLLPRLEFAPGAAPAVAPALYAAGFTVEQTHEFLVCTPDTFTSPHGGPLAETPHSDDDFLSIDAALSEAFTGEFASSAGGAARLRRLQDGGGAVRFVRAPDGTCAGGATCAPTAVGTAELAGVGTRPPYRGRGVAAAVTAAVAAAMFTQGAASVWLEYSGDGSRRVYERLGFRPTGTRLYLHLPA